MALYRCRLRGRWPIHSLRGVIMRISAIIACWNCTCTGRLRQGSGTERRAGARRGRPVRRARKAFRAWPARRGKPARKVLRDPQGAPGGKGEKGDKVTGREGRQGREGRCRRCWSEVGPGGRRGELRGQRDPGVGVLPGRRRGRMAQNARRRRPSACVCASPEDLASTMASSAARACKVSPCWRASGVQESGGRHPVAAVSIGPIPNCRTANQAGAERRQAWSSELAPT